MAKTQIIEGTAQEIAALLQADAFAGLKLRVIVETEEEFAGKHAEPPHTIRDATHLEQLLREGLNSGPAEPMTDAEWEDIRREVYARAVQRKGAS